MQNQVPTRAAIDIGSNTLHIVVAQATPDDLHILADEVDMVRIGESVNATGEISTQKRDEALAVLRKYLDLAAHYYAQPVLAVATEAIRIAKNGAAFLADIERETGLSVQLIDGEVEAVLSFYGATYEHTSDAPERIGVMDLGGGSAELVVAKQQEIIWRTSLPIGSGWLHDRYLPSNPPTVDELDIAGVFLKAFLDGLRIKRFPSALIVTGGSANSLLHLARSAFALKVEETRLTRDELVRCEGLLSALSAEEVSQRYQQPLSRAKILPAGALMIRMVMERFHLHEIHVSPHGIREGALLAYARDGEQWLERVQQSNKGSSVTTPPLSQINEREGESFARSGRRFVLERARKMLEWRDEVLKHDDIEAVHKMRVATRRLRAVLDAYETLCNPKEFKRVYRRVKQIADTLGMARDTDVMIEGLQKQLEKVSPEEQAGLRWLIDRLSEYRQMHQDELEEFFEEFDEDAFKKRIASSLFQAREAK